MLICSNEVGLNLRHDFKMIDFKETLQKKEFLRLALENDMKRRHPNASHNPKLKEILVKHALKFSVASALSFSNSIGGPKKSTLKAACQAKVPILPYLDKNNLLNHLDVFKSILVGSYINDPDSPVLDCSQIPIQVSIDATAVDGKLSTRQSDNGDPDFRLLYGLNGGCTQQPLIVLEEVVGKDLLKKSKPRDK